MKISTLHKIARQIRNSRRIIERRTVNQMTEALEVAAGARSKREAAYIIATEVFDMDDSPSEDGGDRRRINDILTSFEGSWWPVREEVAS